jgi:hypothetical protein
MANDVVQQIRRLRVAEEQKAARKLSGLIPFLKDIDKEIGCLAKGSVNPPCPITDAVPIFQHTHRRLSNVCHGAMEALRLAHGHIEFYLSSHRDARWSSYDPPERGVPTAIIVPEKELSAYDDDELQFIIGHEIGHLLLNHEHVCRPIRCLYPGLEEMPVPALVNFRLWQKASEFSADRIGFLSVGSRLAAESALATKAVRIAVHSSGHPSAGLRIKALELFSASQVYAEWVEAKKISRDRELDMMMKREIFSMLNRIA